ncbi:MAG TPA: crosslink repair DNA glycosylase YcaQ family protein [Pseudonocardia sp.]|nr:crosslink repair DNA glycosylase YcaQ family protein [Pseudonocardia sp.]
MEVTWRQVLRWRLRRQPLVEPAPDALAVARRVCGLHAPVASCTALIAGARSAAPPDLETALWRERSLVRTWAMRGTLHLRPNITTRLQCRHAAPLPSTLRTHLGNHSEVEE